MNTKNTFIQPAIFFNSLAFFILSYFFIFIVIQFSTAFAANAFFDIPVTIYNNKIAYNVKADAWTFDSVKIIFSAANISLFLVTITCLVIYIKSVEFDGILRMFFLWSFIHALSTLVGSAIIGAFSFEGFGIVMSYLYLQDTAKMIILFLGIIFILFVGLVMVKYFLFSANIYFPFLSPEMRHSFRMNQFVLPFLAGNLIILLFKYPASLYEFLIIWVPLLMLLPLFWGIHRFPTFYFEDVSKSIKVDYSLIATAISATCFLRFLLERGIYLG